MSASDLEARSGANTAVVRHQLADRLLHWSSAACVLVLLATGFLPIVGLKFEWVTIHWVAGVVLLVLIVLHVLRSSSTAKIKAIWFGWQDVRMALSYLTIDSAAQAKPGKYSPAQKLMHLGVTVLVLATVVTGLIMMVKIDTPFWERNIYLLEDATWGVIYVIHGLAALTLITTVMLHIYFSLRPEKSMYLRSMIKGWLTAKEAADLHDPKKWGAHD